MLKKTYSPDETILSSSAANIISLTVKGFAQTTTTGKNNIMNKEGHIISHIQTYVHVYDI